MKVDPDQWAAVQEQFGGRSKKACVAKLWREKEKQRRKGEGSTKSNGGSGAWTDEENATLLNSKSGGLGWQEISDRIPGRKPAACQRRWKKVQSMNKAAQDGATQDVQPTEADAAMAGPSRQDIGSEAPDLDVLTEEQSQMFLDVAADLRSGERSFPLFPALRTADFSNLSRTVALWQQGRAFVTRYRRGKRVPKMLPFRAAFTLAFNDHCSKAEGSIGKWGY